MSAWLKCSSARLRVGDVVDFSATRLHHHAEGSGERVTGLRIIEAVDTELRQSYSGSTWRQVRYYRLTLTDGRVVVVSAGAKWTVMM